MNDNFIPGQNADQEAEALDADIVRLGFWRESALEFRRRRHTDWLENYQLYRDKVIINRITQRQSVNIPLMKSTIQTLLKDVDDAPMLYFENLDNDDQAELFYNEYWKYVSRENKLVIDDIVDKKQVMLFGRTFKFLNIIDGMFTWEVVDPQNVGVDRYINPSRLDSARFIFRDGIFKPLSEIERNQNYDQKELKKMHIFFESETGVLISDTNGRDAYEAAERQESLGVQNVQHPTLGETYVQLEEFYVKEYDAEEDCDIIFYYVVAEHNYKLFRGKLSDVIGETKDDYWDTHFPCVSWGSDPERTDFWSDGVSDSMRGPNKILNTWWSQEVENRTLKNFNMKYYDASISPDFQPQVWTAEPWGYYGTPGDPNKILTEFPIPDLGGNIDDMNFLMTLAEKASAATATNQGQTQNNITLGDVQLAYQNAQERVKALGVFYTDAWLEFGVKYTKMLEANEDNLNDIEISKKGKLGLRHWSRTISAKDWKSENGYSVDVKMVSDKTKEDSQAVNKISAVMQFFPGNIALLEVLQKKSLDFAGLSLEEKTAVLEAEKQKAQMMPDATAAAQQDPNNPQQALPPGAPQPPQPTPPGAPTPQGGATPPSNGAQPNNLQAMIARLGAIIPQGGGQPQVHHA